MSHLFTKLRNKTRSTCLEETRHLDCADTDIDPPGAHPKVDDQGNLGVCVMFAEAKSVCSGFMKKKFSPGQELDFLQTDISTAMVNTDKVR